MQSTSINNMHVIPINYLSQIRVGICDSNTSPRKGSLLEEATTEIDQESIAESVETQDDSHIGSANKQKAKCKSRRSIRKFSTQSDPIDAYGAYHYSLENETRTLPKTEKETLPKLAWYGHYNLEGVYPTLEEDVKVGSNMHPGYGCVMLLVGNCIFLLGVIEHLPVIK
jgi:hypothetical protein